MGPRPMRHRPAAACFQTQRDGCRDLRFGCPRGAGRPAAPHLAPPSRAPRSPASGRARRGRASQLRGYQTHSTPKASRSARASSPNAARSISEGVRQASLPRGSESTCDMTSAASARDGRSRRRPRPLGSSFLISTWFFSQPPFWSARRGSQ